LSSDSETPQGRVPSFSLVEKAADGKFFLHILCLALYLDMAAGKVLGKALPEIAWSDFHQIAPGTYFMTLLVYSALMGLGFKIIYGVLTYSLGWVNTVYLNGGRDTWRKDSSYVSEQKIRLYTFISKDTKPMEELQAQKEINRVHRKGVNEFGFLMFAAMAFLSLGYGSDSYVHNVLLPWIEVHKFFAVLYGMVLLGFGFMVWLDATADAWQDQYLYHPELAKYLEGEEKASRPGGCY
jgi:hypothetical protein